MSLDSSDLPLRSSDGMAALDVFYAGFNQINFYVEDADQENLYEVILRRQFPDIRIDRIFPLGGKEAVRRHAQDPGNSGLPAYRAYILDRDFDDILRRRCIHSNIFYLDRFCIENYLLEELALIEVVIESHPKLKRSQVRLELNVAGVVRQIFQDLRALFICFAFVQRFGIELKNCGSAAETYCRKNARWEVDPSALDAYAKSIRQKMGDGEEPFFNPHSDGRIADAACLDDHQLVSGKYVATMIFHYLKHRYGLGSVSFDSFVYRLAKNCKFDSLRELSACIRQAAEDFKKGEAGVFQASPMKLSGQ